MTSRPRRHLRDVATICPAALKLSNGYVLNRCQLDVGHLGSHQDGCTRWAAAVHRARLAAEGTDTP